MMPVSLKRGSFAVEAGDDAAGVEDSVAGAGAGTVGATAAAGSGRFVLAAARFTAPQIHQPIAVVAKIPTTTSSPTTIRIPTPGIAGASTAGTGVVATCTAVLADGDGVRCDGM